MTSILKFRVRSSLPFLIASQLAFAAPPSSDTLAQSNLFRSRPGSGEQPFTQDLPRQTPTPTEELTPVTPPPALRLPSDVLKRSKNENSNAAKASENVQADGSRDDEILQLLRQSDKAFSSPAVPLPDGIAALSDGPLQNMLSLEEALARTLQNSYSYAAASAVAEGAVYGKNAALGQLGPTLDVRAQRGREYSAPASFINPANGRTLSSDTHIRWDNSVILRQPLFAPASYFEYRKQASLANAADLRKEDAREALYYTTIKAYYDLLRSYVGLTFARSYTERMDTLQDYMNKRLQGGGASKVDFERVRGRALTARSTMIEAEGVLESAMVTLAQLTGVRSQQLGIPSKMMPVVPTSSRLALEQIYENNPAVRAARQDAAAANEELKSARSRFSPNFSVEVSQARTDNAGGDGRLTTDRRYMLVMNMNLLNGGSDYYYQKQIGSKYVEKVNTASDIERKLKEQIEINYRTLDAVRKRIAIARQAYQTNADVADVFLEQLAVGNKQLLDVLDAYQQAYLSRVELSQLLFLQADISYQILRNTGRASSFVEGMQHP
jgi:adhesin transport system outer membrane protein